MKHSGLAAELHVVHWSFLVDTEGKEGEEEESRQRPQQHLTVRVWAQPSPSSPNRLPAVPSCPRMQGHISWLPGSTCSLCGPDEHLAEGQRPGLRPPHQSAAGRLLSIQLTNPSQAGTVARSQTAPHTHAQVHPPLPCPGPHPQTARNRTSLIFLICSCLTLEKPSQMSLMLNKEKC